MIIYGLKNCDRCRAFLKAYPDFKLIDVSITPVPENILEKAIENFGEKLYYDSTRINLGLIQNDINVLWDLAVHDLSILNYLYKDNETTRRQTESQHVKRNFHHHPSLHLPQRSNR